MQIYALDNKERILKEIGCRVKTHRVDLRMTQNDLAEKTGLSLRTIGAIENGKDTSFGNLILILRTLGLTQNLDKLFPENDYAPRRKSIDLKTRYRKKRIVAKADKWGDER